VNQAYFEALVLGDPKGSVKVIAMIHTDNRMLADTRVSVCACRPRPSLAALHQAVAGLSS
jgi:hypothetical protein